MKTRDIVSEALTEIADLWKVDHARVIPTDDGFDWWPGDFRVSVTATRRTDGLVREAWMLSVKTDFLKDVPIDDSRFVRLATAMAGVSGTTFAWVFPPAEVWRHHGVAGTRPQLWFADTAYLTPEAADWVPEFLAHMSIMQPINARMAAVAATTLGGGAPNVSSSALLGRSQQGDVLDAKLGTYSASGNAANRWIATGEFDIIADNWNEIDGCVCGSNDERFRLEVQLGDMPAVITLSTNQRHPQLGNGLHCDLMLPIVEDRTNISERCMALNLSETMWTDIPQFGCWRPFRLEDDLACLSFAVFVPNVMYAKGIASLMVLWFHHRIRWVMYGKYATRG